MDMYIRLHLFSAQSGCLESSMSSALLTYQYPACQVRIVHPILPPFPVLMAPTFPGLMHNGRLNLPSWQANCKTANTPKTDQSEEIPFTFTHFLLSWIRNTAEISEGTCSMLTQAYHATLSYCQFQSLPNWLTGSLINRP